MKRIFKLTAIAIALLFLPALGGCELLGIDPGSGLVGAFQDLQAKGESYAAPKLADLLEYRCATMSLEQRRHLAEQVNATEAARGKPHRVGGADCDGDRLPDF